MKTSDLQKIREAVEVMAKLLSDLGVMDEKIIFDPNMLPAVKWFASEIMLDSSRAKIEQLTQLCPNEARVFLLLLNVVYGEINPGAAMSVSTPEGTPQMYHTAAYAVERETAAFANHRPFVTALTE